MRTRPRWVAAGWGILLALSLWCAGAGAAGNVRYVTETGAGTRNGTSWGHAFASSDLGAAIQGAAPGDEVWVAQGTYLPGVTSGDSFVLKPGVSVYGGFGGTETRRDQRAPKTHVTILSGNIGDPATSADNVYHVVTAPFGVTGSTVLDGFTIRDGNARGGFFVSTGLGGGLYNESANPRVSHCTFLRNDAFKGGGIGNAGPEASPVITDCTFRDNGARSGGGMASSGSNAPQVSACTFTQNRAGNGGAVYGEAGSAEEIVNCTFVENVAWDDGGGALLLASNHTRVRNCTFLNNRTTRAFSRGQSIYVLDCSPTDGTAILHCILWNSVPSALKEVEYAAGAAPTFEYGVLRGTYDGNEAALHLLSGDPLLAPLADNGGFTQTCAILPGSSAADVDSPHPFPATDQRGVSRPQGPKGDYGAFEKPFVPSPSPTPSPSPGTPTPGEITPSPVPEVTPDPGTVTPLPTSLRTPTPVVRARAAPHPPRICFVPSWSSSRPPALPPPVARRRHPTSPRRF